MAASEGSSHDESIYKGYVEDFEISCEPCKNDGNVVEASGYCQNCDEYLCITCMKTHCRTKPCRHHVVLDKHQMPHNNPEQSKVAVLCTVICDKHPSECLKFFCKKHEVTRCGDCIILEHRTCDVDYISTLADGYNTSTEYTSVIQKVERLQTEVNALLEDAGQTAVEAEATIEKALTDIKQYRKDVDAYFAKAECIIMAKCGEIKELNHRESTKISDALTSSGNELTSIHASLTSNIENTANLYVRAKESLSILETLRNEMQVIKQTQFQCVEFAKNISLTSDRLTEASLGVLQVSDLSIYTRAQHTSMLDRIVLHKADVNVVLRNDRRTCYMSGIVHLHDNIVVCTALTYKSVKLVDIHKNEVLSAVSLMDQPWDITSISPDTIAVTISLCNKIQFLGVKNDVLSEKNVIVVNGTCRGIDCFDDKLVVSYDDDPPKVEILDFYGNVLKLMQTDKVGTELFKYPSYIAFSQDGRSIYVSDCVDNSIIKLTLDGTVQASYKDSKLKNPNGVFVCRDGSVLVCSRKHIFIISDDFERQKILNTDDGKADLVGICYGEVNGKIICSKRMRKKLHMKTDIIQVFTLG